MKKNNNKNHLFTLLLAIITFLILFVVLLTPIQALPLMQSELPKPKNPNFVTSFNGGRVFCGLQQSSTWLHIPTDFTSEGGAEIHCDPVGPLSEWNGTRNAWGDQGYVIGLWPSDIPIQKSFRLIFEVDPAQTTKICNECFSGRYFIPNSGWQDLPTFYDIDNARVFVTITEYLTPSDYPNYADRFLIALFVYSGATATPVPTTTSISTPRPTSSVVSTKTPFLTVTVQPSPSLTFTPTPIENFEVVETPTAKPPSVIRTPDLTPYPTESVVRQGNIPFILLLLGSLIIILILVIIFLSRKRS